MDMVGMIMIVAGKNKKARLWVVFHVNLKQYMLCKRALVLSHKWEEHQLEDAKQLSLSMP